MISDNDVAFVDFRFTDPRGKWQHTAQTVGTVGEEVFEDQAKKIAAFQNKHKQWEAQGGVVRHLTFGKI